jgi:hypothetical protein
MLPFLGTKVSDRKPRLFAVACCRCSRQLLKNKDHRHALEISARFADGQATEQELAAAYRRANDFAVGLYHDSKSEREIHRWAEATAVANALAVVTPSHPMGDYATDAAWMIDRATPRSPNKRLADLLRDVFGNPFRPATLDPSWLAWNDGLIVKLAQGICDDRAFDRMPILADALEEAGCTDGDILGHCRQEGEHVRGCWLVDLLTGRS